MLRPCGSLLLSQNCFSLQPVQTLAGDSCEQSGAWRPTVPPTVAAHRQLQSQLRRCVASYSPCCGGAEAVVTYHTSVSQLRLVYWIGWMVFFVKLYKFRVSFLHCVYVLDLTVFLYNLKT